MPASVQVQVRFQSGDKISFLNPGGGETLNFRRAGVLGQQLKTRGPSVRDVILIRPPIFICLCTEQTHIREVE